MGGVISILFATLGLIAPEASEDAHPADLPLFVVERSRVIWPQRCPRTENRVPPELQWHMRMALGENGLFIGDGRMDEVTFGPPECMHGECGSGQFAVPLVVRESERYGLVLPPGRIETSAIRPLRLVNVEGADPGGFRPGLATPDEMTPSCREPPLRPPVSPGDGLLITCLSYLETNGRLGVQVQGRGRLQEDGLARYDVVRFRVFERREGKSVVGLWHGQPRGKGSRLPVPVAAVPGANGFNVRLLWLRWEGICCPSAASAWVTDVGEHAREGPRHIAGFGRPCD